MGTKGIKRRAAGLLLAALAFAGLTAPARALEAEQGQQFQISTPFFSDKRVMVIVPHQDDEVNLAGGIIEQYARAGSQVTIVYATNGDYNGLAELRSQEALAVAQAMGLPAENVIYLGYGDQWEHQNQAGAERKHIYFSVDGDAVWTSHFGATHTYGTSVIDCYADSAYTRNNFLGDLTDVILERRPDVIYCVDYDAHHDHMALDLFFEEAMGNIRKQDPDYHPTVYKGFCYGTAWYAEGDFVGAENLRSSQFPTWEHWERLGIGYDWDERVRLPVSAGNLSRLLSQTEIYQTLRLFQSQDGYRFAERVLNGDKVFWQRRTDSLLSRAEFFDEDGPVTVWNDFKLMDAEDFSALVNTGVRYAGKITVALEAPVEMDAVWLYDAPSRTDNILAGCLEFDDGSRMDFGPLEAGGAATRIEFPARTVGGFEIIITKTEGERPGLTEIEAYCDTDAASQAPQILMAVDEQGDFVYDHWLPMEGRAEFSLYAYPSGSVSGWADVNIELTGDSGCGWSLENGKLQIVCPPGVRAQVTVSWSEEVYTTFSLSNPDSVTRLAHRLAQVIDRQLAYGREQADALLG